MARYALASCMKVTLIHESSPNFANKTCAFDNHNITSANCRQPWLVARLLLITSLIAVAYDSACLFLLCHSCSDSVRRVS